jgi:sulfate transport system permease protein
VIKSLSSFFYSKRVIPGMRVNLSLSLTYLLFIVIVPLACLFLAVKNTSWEEIYNTLTNERSLSAFKVSFTISLIAATFCLFIGLPIAWVLVRYRFFGRRLFDSIIDLPFAMPTSVSGITLATVYAQNGWIGKWLAKVGIEVAYTPLGIFVALVFIGLPFVVRAVQPAIQELDSEMEEAAACLGASRRQTLTRVVFPNLFPSLLTGFTLALSRGLGEYGSVIFIAGNIPYLSEIVPLLIVVKLEEFKYEQASILAIAMLGLSLILLIFLKLIEALLKRRIA